MQWMTLVVDFHMTLYMVFVFDETCVDSRRVIMYYDVLIKEKV